MRAGRRTATRRADALNDLSRGQEYRQEGLRVQAHAEASVSVEANNA